MKSCDPRVCTWLLLFVRFTRGVECSRRLFFPILNKSNVAHLCNGMLSISFPLTTSYTGNLKSSAVESEVQCCNEHSIILKSLIPQKLSGISILLRIMLQAFYQLLSHQSLFCFMSVTVLLTHNSLLNSIVKHHCWFWNCIRTATSFQNKNRATKKVSMHIKVTWFITSEDFP